MDEENIASLENSIEYGEEKTEEYLAYGTVFKALRTAKKMTQDEAAGTATSAPHLSEFEHGKTMLRAHTFFAVLRNIHVNQYEFENRYNEYLQKKDALLYDMEVSQAFTERNIAKLKTILEKIKSSLEVNKNQKKLKLDKIQVEALIKQIDPSFKILLEDISFLKYYLEDIEEWGQYEIILFGHTVALITPPELIKLTDHMIDPTNADIGLHYIRLAIIRAVLNVIDTLAKKHLYKEANKYIQYLKESQITDYYTYEKLTLIYNEAQLKYIQGNIKALDTMKKCQEVFAFCDCYNMANTIEHEIASLTNKTEKANKSEQH